MTFAFFVGLMLAGYRGVFLQAGPSASVGSGFPAAHYPGGLLTGVLWDALRSEGAQSQEEAVA